MISQIIDKIAGIFTNFGFPGELKDALQLISELFFAIPANVRLVMIGLFSVACTLAILKMLF